MSTITKERMREIRDFDTCVTLEESAELARIALASLEAEPAIHRWRRVTVEPYGPTVILSASQNPLRELRTSIFTPEQWAVICMAANSDMENRLYALKHGETMRLERERTWAANREKVGNQNG